MREQNLGGLRCRLAGGTDRQGGGDGPVVVLLHGYGAAGDDLVPLGRMLDVPPTVRFVLPEAPLALGPMGGRAWWRLDESVIERSLRGETVDRSNDHPEGMDAARDQVQALLDTLPRVLGADPAKVVLGGFSQGSMVTLDVALHGTTPLAGLAVLSGTLLDAGAWLPRMPARRGLPVFQSHGTVDPLLPFAVAERLRDQLLGAGLTLDWHAFRGGHEIPTSVLVALGRFITRVTGA